MSDLEKGLKKIWDRLGSQDAKLGEIRDLLAEIRDGLISVDDAPEEPPAEEPTGPRAVG